MFGVQKKILLMGITLHKIDLTYLKVNMTEKMTRGVPILQTYKDDKCFNMNYNLIVPWTNKQVFLGYYFT